MTLEFEGITLEHDGVMTWPLTEPQELGAEVYSFRRELCWVQVCGGVIGLGRVQVFIVMDSITFQV